MGAPSREHLVCAAKELDLWPVRDTDDWRRQAKSFLDDRDRVHTACREVNGFNVSPTAGVAFVDLLIQAHVRAENEPLRRMSASAAGRFDVMSVRFESRETKERGGDECSATTAFGTLCRNRGTYAGLCFAHAHKCVFFEMDSERRLKPCGRIAIAGDFCRLHEHRREEVEEERKAEEELQRDVERAVTSDESSFLSRASELVARVVPSQPRTCKGTTKGNTPCRRPPERGRDYCNSHKDQDPKKDGEREPESDAPQTENIVDEVEHSGTSDALTTGNHRCQGRRRYDGENCLLRPRIGSKYCRHHQDQDPNYETDQLLHKFEKYVETRNVIEQTEMLEEVLDDVDEYALVTYTLLKSSNQRSAKISSMMGFRKPKTRQVDLTIYPSTLIFQYPDEQDNKDKVLDTYKLSQITSVVISAGQNPSTGLRTMRLRFKGKGAKNKEFVNISLDTAQEIKQVIKHLKVKQVIEARQFIETKYKDQPPYRRWLDQAKEAAAAEPSLTVYGVLFERNSQKDNELHKGYFQEKNDDDDTVVYWWGSSRNKRTGRKIGDGIALKQFLKELEDAINESHSKYTIEDSANEQGEDDEFEEEEITSGGVDISQSRDLAVVEQKDFSADGWLDELVKECDQEARDSAQGDDDDDTYTIKFRELVRDKLKLSGKDTEGKAMNERLLVPLGQYQKPSGFFWWDAGCRRQPIGDVNKLKEFGSRMDELFRENFADLNRTSRTIGDTFKRNTWARKKGLGRPLAQAFATAFKCQERDVPEVINDSERGKADENKFRVDMYGNVIAAEKGDVGEKNTYRVCAIEYDHVLPYSRGGLTNEKNIEPISLMANQRKKAKLLHGPLYYNGWNTGENRLDCGMTVEQFVSVWVYMRDETHDPKSGNPYSLRGLVKSIRGKKLIEACFMSPSYGGRTGWKELSAILCGNHPSLNPCDRNQPRPMGAQLFKILTAYADCFSLTDFLKTSKNCVYPHLPPYPQ